MLHRRAQTQECFSSLALLLCTRRPHFLPPPRDSLSLVVFRPFLTAAYTLFLSLSPHFLFSLSFLVCTTSLLHPPVWPPSFPLLYRSPRFTADPEQCGHDNRTPAPHAAENAVTVTSPDLTTNGQLLTRHFTNNMNSQHHLVCYTYYMPFSYDKVS